MDRTEFREMLAHMEWADAHAWRAAPHDRQGAHWAAVEVSLPSHSPGAVGVPANLAGRSVPGDGVDRLCRSRGDRRVGKAVLPAGVGLRGDSGRIEVRPAGRVFMVAIDCGQVRQGDPGDVVGKRVASVLAYDVSPGPDRDSDSRARRRAAAGRFPGLGVEWQAGTRIVAMGE